MIKKAIRSETAGQEDASQETLDFDEFRDWMATLSPQFSPVEGKEKPEVPIETMDNVESVDLRSLPDGSLVWVAGYAHTSSGWLIEVRDDRVNGGGEPRKYAYIFKGPDCLKGPVEAVASYDVGSGGEPTFIPRPGALTVEKALIFPYFEPRQDGKIPPPKATWADECRDIRIMIPK